LYNIDRIKTNKEMLLETRDIAADIELQGVRKAYPGGTEALAGVDLVVPAGTRFALLGPNGAGKSTLIRLLTSLSRPDSGRVRVCGLDPLKETARLMRLIGVANQENDLDPEERLRHHLVFQGRLFGLSAVRAHGRADDLIELFGLEEHATKRVRELSGGNKRRLHCALSLVHRPRLLFLDEPTVGMDPEIRAAFWESIRSINREERMTLFLTSQYLEEAEKHATEMALIRDGEIAYTGGVEAFIDGFGRERARSLEEGYLHYMKEALHAD
jgi:ABC-2 type transport system ATP-binding protein